MIHVSRGNTKLGNIPSFNLPPVLTCRPDVPCHSRCYARKAYECYSTNAAKPAWDDNMAASLRLGFMTELLAAVKKATLKIKFFRVHSSGDFHSKDYLRQWYWVASQLPDVRFLAYTKRFSWVSESEFLRPQNFQIIYSLWYPMEAPDSPYPTSIVLGVPGETRIPDFICPGSCKYCKACWFLEPGRTVGFNIH